MVRTLTAQRPGPVLVALNLPAGSVNIVSAPDATTAELKVRATTDDPALIDVVERAVLRWDEAGALRVSVPELPDTAVHTVVRGGTVITGGVISGNVLVSGGRVVVNGVTVSGPGAVAVGTIEIAGTVPEGCNIDVRGTAAELTAAGEFGDTAKTVSGAVTAGGVQTLTVTSTSGAVRADAVDQRAEVRTVSGGVHLGRTDGRVEIRSTSGAITLADFAGAASLATVSGSITAHASEGGTIAASSTSGAVTVTATDAAIAEGLHTDARSLTGHVRTPQAPPAATRTRRPRRTTGGA